MNRSGLRISEDIELRPLSYIHAYDFVKAMVDPSISHHALTIPFPYDINNAIAFIDMIRNFEKKNGVQQEWSIIREEELIGGIGLLWNHGVTSHKSEIGYWIRKDYRGRGLMTDIVKKFSDMIFENTQLIRLEAHVFTFNQPSARVLEKAGYTAEGLGRKKYAKQGEFIDAYLFSLCK